MQEGDATRSEIRLRHLLPLGIFLLLASQLFARNDFARLAIVLVSGTAIAHCWLRRKRSTASKPGFVVFLSGIAALSLICLWSALNLVRVYTYDSAVENNSPQNVIYWFVVSIQPIVAWCAGGSLLTNWLLTLVMGCKRKELLKAKNV